MTTLWLALCTMLSLVDAFAQASAPTFEVASVKPSNTPTGSSSWHSRTGYLVIRNQTLNDLIRIAYQLKADSVSGGPNWITSDRFDIEARSTGPAKDPELLAMLQTLLAERFQLKLQRSTKLVPGYALVVAKGGLKIRPVEAGGSKTNTGRGKMIAERTSMDKLAEMLARTIGAPVVNMTDTAGVFTYQLEWSPESTQVSARPDVDDAALGASLFTVLQQQLGLKLEPRKEPIQVLIVEKAERPEAN